MKIIFCVSRTAQWTASATCRGPTPSWWSTASTTRRASKAASRTCRPSPCTTRPAGLKFPSSCWVTSWTWTDTGWYLCVCMCVCVLVVNSPCVAVSQEVLKKNLPEFCFYSIKAPNCNSRLRLLCHFTVISCDFLDVSRAKCPPRVSPLSGRWAAVTARPWLLSSAACSSRCPPVWTLSPSSTSSTRRWGGRGGGGAAATTRRPSSSTRTRLCWTPPPSPRPATRSCPPRPPPSWWRWRRRGLRANGEPPRSPC